MVDVREVLPHELRPESSRYLAAGNLERRTYLQPSAHAGLKIAVSAMKLVRQLVCHSALIELGWHTCGDKVRMDVRDEQVASRSQHSFELSDGPFKVSYMTERQPAYHQIEGVRFEAAKAILNGGVLEPDLEAFSNCRLSRDSQHFGTASRAVTFHPRRASFSANRPVPAPTSSAALPTRLSSMLSVYRSSAAMSVFQAVS